MHHRPTHEPLAPATRRTVVEALRTTNAGDMTRRQFVALATALGLSMSTAATLLAACGGKQGGGASPTPMDTTLPSQLNLWNWAGYISPKVLKDFEKEYGVKCVVKPIRSLEASVRELGSQPSAYDVFFSADTYITPLREAGLLRPLDMSLIPNFANVTQQAFRSPPFDPGSDGDKYTVPYMFGTVGIAVRIDKVADPGESWDMLFDPRNRGQVGMIQLMREMFSAALFSLGYSPNTTSQSELDEATDALIKQKRLYAQNIDMTAPATVIINGNGFTECWDGDAIYAMNELGLKRVRYVLPSEGYIVWSDALCIPKKAASPYAAHLFLNFILDPANAAACANFLGYQPVVEAADPLIKSMMQRSLRPTEDVLARGVFIEDVGDFTAQYEAAFKKVQKA
jgi:spermidine/putrescine transport system substrate-binding protein